MVRTLQKRQELRIPFGKHSGKTWDLVLQIDYDYIRWLAGYQTATKADPEKRIEHRVAKKVMQLCKKKRGEYITHKAFLDAVYDTHIQNVIQNIQNNLELIPTDNFWGKAWFVTFKNHPEWV